MERIRALESGRELNESGAVVRGYTDSLLFIVPGVKGPELRRLLNIR